MLSRDNPIRTAEMEALQFAWEPRRFNQRVHEIAQVLRAGPVDPRVISLASRARSRPTPHRRAPVRARG